MSLRRKARAGRGYFWVSLLALGFSGFSIYTCADVSETRDAFLLFTLYSVEGELATRVEPTMRSLTSSPYVPVLTVRCYRSSKTQICLTSTRPRKSSIRAEEPGPLRRLERSWTSSRPPPASTASLPLKPVDISLHPFSSSNRRTITSIEPKLINFGQLLLPFLPPLPFRRLSLL
jgi:hypothetical protein